MKIYQTYFTLILQWRSVKFGAPRARKRWKRSLNTEIKLLIVMQWFQKLIYYNNNNGYSYFTTNKLI